ncbi:MAG: methionyl-tRNA formyltransferase [Geminicoccaceae bacterium]|nr:methionyl-tRNA formyltransferase [Geminicoccaceae bacterium]
MPLRLVFFGSAAFAVPALAALARSPHRLLLVLSQPPRPAGRGLKERPTPVHEVAQRLGLPVRTPESLREPAILEELRALAPDLGVVAAYGLILPEAVLRIPRLGCVNLHASLLPRWRGAAPIQRAILAGDPVTGVCLMQMDRGLDTGPVLARRETPIGPRETAGELHDRLAAMAAELLLEELPAIEGGTARATPQPEDGASYAAKLGPEDQRLDFAQSAIALDRRIRALAPAPGAFCFARGERLVVLEAEPREGPRGEPGTVVAPPLVVACGEGALALLRVKRAGRKAMSAEELQRGFPLPVGTHLE